jgi:hypothetical protein
MRYVTILKGMVGGNLGDDAICSEDLENVETFCNRCRECDEPVLFWQALGFFALTSGHASMTRPKTDEALDAGIFDQACEVASPFVFQRDPRMFLDFVFDRGSYVSAEDVGFCVELVYRCCQCRHSDLLRSIKLLLNLQIK